jgi:hypothetical protein
MIMRKSRSPNLTAVVFVQTKQATPIVSHVLSRVAELNPALAFLRVSYVVGGQKSGFIK